MDTTSYLRLVTRNAELSEAIEKKIGDCVRELDVSDKDLTALSLGLQSITVTFTTIKTLLQDPHFPQATNTGLSQAQKDAMAALAEVLGRCEMFFNELHHVFIGIEGLKDKKARAEAALRSFITAKAGLRAAKSRLEELQEYLPVTLAVVCIHGSLRQLTDWTLDVHIGKLVVFRRKQVRYGVDSEEVIKLHTLVAKTVLAAQIYGVNGMKMNESIDVDARKMIEAWTASTDRLKTNSTTGLGHRPSDPVTTAPNGINKDNNREMGKAAVNHSKIEKHHQADPTQNATLSSTEKDQTEEISPGQLLDVSTMSKAQLSISSSSDPNFQRYPKVANKQDAEAPTASTTKAQTAKLVKNPSSAHRRASFAVWMKKWYKPR